MSMEKIVVDVTVRSTDKMNEAFKEKDDKYREWATKDTLEDKVAKAEMVLIIISHEGRSTRTLSRDGKTSLLTSKLIGCGWPRTSCATMSSSSVSSSTRAAGYLTHGEESTQRKMQPKKLGLQEES